MMMHEINSRSSKLLVAANKLNKCDVRCIITILCDLENSVKVINEPHREKTGFLPMRKQRRRSASQ